MFPYKVNKITYIAQISIKTHQKVVLAVQKWYIYTDGLVKSCPELLTNPSLLEPQNTSYI